MESMDDAAIDGEGNFKERSHTNQS